MRAGLAGVGIRVALRGIVVCLRVVAFRPVIGLDFGAVAARVTTDFLVLPVRAGAALVVRTRLRVSAGRSQRCHGEKKRKQSRAVQFVDCGHFWILDRKGRKERRTRAARRSEQSALRRSVEKGKPFWGPASKPAKRTHTVTTKRGKFGPGALPCASHFDLDAKEMKNRPEPFGIKGKPAKFANEKTI